jgi:hypothetical protein
MADIPVAIADTNALYRLFTPKLMTPATRPTGKLSREQATSWCRPW